MYGFIFSDYGEFDPEQQWLGYQAAPSLTQFGIAGKTRFTLIKVTAPSCNCNSYLESHLTELQEDLEGSIEIVPRTVAQVEASGFTVPATPMALVFDNHTLAYAGPFASGPFCASEDSLIRDILSGKTRLAGLYLNGLVQACRCLNDGV